MSSQNLKVYRTEFVTEVGEMNFKVKFACQVKMIWKRSNESAETTLVPVENGVVRFNQALKLNVNMYFDPSANKFVEKKCMYSFLIITDKGEKSAGRVTFDLGDFLNKRKYEVDEDFSLEKCPLPDTKIRLKIYYNQSTEKGYDTMSQISAADPNLDMSTTSMDISDLATSKKETEEGAENTEPSKKEEETESNYDLLNESDLGQKVASSEGEERGEKIAQNIQALNQISGKISDFVTRCSGNIRNEIENLKRKNNSLEEALSVEKFEKLKLAEKSEESRVRIGQLEKRLSDEQAEKEAQLTREKHKNAELEEKLEQSKKLCTQLESNLSETGESQSSYLQELKQGYEKGEQRMKATIEELEGKLMAEKKEKNELAQKVAQLEHLYKELKAKYGESQERNEQLLRKEEKRESEIEDLRFKLESVYENLVGSLGDILK